LLPLVLLDLVAQFSFSVLEFTTVPYIPLSLPGQIYLSVRADIGRVNAVGLNGQ